MTTKLRRRKRLDHVTRFWQYVQKADDCWLWSGFKSRQGYGRFWLEGRPRFASRIALAQAMGKPIPLGLRALHTCDTPACVRNDEVGVYIVNGIEFPRWGHLWLGTNADNSADMVAKGRWNGPAGERDWGTGSTVEEAFAANERWLATHARRLSVRAESLLAQATAEIDALEQAVLHA
jgi:hypothetical protein